MSSNELTQTTNQDTSSNQLAKKLVSAEEINNLTNEELLQRGYYEVLYNKNIGLMTEICSKFLNTGIPFEDLRSICDYSFMKSLENFNPRYKWVTYFWKIAEHDILYAYKCKNKETYTISIHSTPSGFTPDSGITLEDTLPSDINIEKDIMDQAKYTELYKAIGELKPRRREIIKMYLNGKTFKEIGELLNVTTQAVHLQYKSALRQLKNTLKKVDL